MAKELLSKLLGRRNVLSVVTVMIGVLSLFGIPQAAGFTNEQLIIGLLSFLAMESIIVNVGYLENLRESSEKMKAKIVHPGLDDLVAPRSNRFDLARLADDAKEVLAWGISLEGLAMDQSNLLIHLANQRCSLRFIVVDPQVSFLDDIDLRMPNHVGADVFKANIGAGLARLAQLYRSLPTGRQAMMEVRLYAGIPFYSGMRVLSRRTTASNSIWMSFYSYGGTPGERRGVLLNAATSPQNYDFYQKAIDRLWAASDPIDIEKYSLHPNEPSAA